MTSCDTRDLKDVKVAVSVLPYAGASRMKIDLHKIFLVIFNQGARMKFFTTPTARFPILCLFSILVLVTPSRHCKAGSDNAIAASWYAFVGNPTVLDALDYLGPTVFDGETSNGHMAVT